jgi:hypothetical protein
MTFWKPAIVGAVLAVSACTPVGAPLGEERLATKIADVVMTGDMTQQFVIQSVQGLMYQGAIQQDQVNQVGMAVSREVEARMPEVRKTLVASLTKEFNIKELDFLLKLLTSKEGAAVSQKYEVAMQEVMPQLDGIAREAATKAVAKLNSAWPTGANPAPAAPPAGMEGLPPGIQLPN